MTVDHSGPEVMEGVGSIFAEEAKIPGQTVTPQPCPFCGHNRARVTLPRMAINTVECGECGASTRGFSRARWRDPDEAVRQAVAAWNRRHG